MRKIVVLGAGLLLVQIPLLALTLLQERTWGGALTDEADEIALASDGSVYVAGTTESADGDRDAVLLKYGPNRELEWTRTYGIPNSAGGFDEEFARGLVVDSANNAYVTGQLGTGVLFLAKFSAAGDLLWDTTWGPNGTIGWTAAIDAAGNIYVAGLSFVVNEGANDTEALLIKFTPDGTVAWARAWGGAGFDAGRAVAVGSDGGIYLTGETNSFFANDAFLVKFNDVGEVVWERDWGVDGVDAPFTGLTSAFGIAADALGNVYITGNASDTGHSKNIILVKFNGAGDIVWEKVGGPGFGNGSDVAVSADGTAVFVSGNMLSDDPDFFGGPAFVAEFTADGRARKANTWGGDPNDGASAESIVIDAAGLIVAAGFAGQGPYEFGRASNSAKSAETHLVIPQGSHNLILDPTIGTDSGALLVPDANVGGVIDTFTLWMAR
jgi:hypothetical protein